MKLTVTVALALACLCGSAFGYTFWGIDAGTNTYDNSTQLTFGGVGSAGVQYAVGGYRYTQVDGTWYGPFPAASPGANYPVHRKMDAQGIFFLSDASAAHFVIFTGMPQTGITASECGYGNRLFGPGDLRLLVNGNDYGVGMRLDNLLWAQDPNTTSSYFQIHKSSGGIDSIYARDAGTLGRVEQNPQWDHVDHPELANDVAAAHAFYVKSSGTLSGSANVSMEDTGINLNGTKVYAYKVDVPWTVLGINQNQFEFQATWGPDCGNDLVHGNFFASVPEPGSIIALLSGLVGFGMLKYRRRS